MEHKVDILIVDDDTDIIALLRELLHDLGLRVAVAYDGKEGYQIAIQLKPRLIVSDVMMPLMRGDDMVEAIRANPETATIPCVLVTAAPQSVSIDSADLLTKPFDLSQLEAVVASYLK